MTDYTKSTNFASKDSLSTGNALKIVKGTELDTEFNNLVTAVATKANSLSPTFTGTPAAPTASTGTNTTQIATTAFVTTSFSYFTGAMMMWPTATAPTGFLLCAGTAVSRSTYAALFAVIGTAYGVGDGSTTFNLPNFNNRTPIGAGDLYAANAQVGSKDAITVAHTHTTSVTDTGHTHPFTASVSSYGPRGGAGGEYWGASPTSSTTGSNSTPIGLSVTVDSSGSSGTNANLQPSLGVFFIIKT
jgi:microcystin-dependent protein